jgi:enterobacterial common antigen flippase
MIAATGGVQERNSYRQIFASTFVIGGASVVNIGIGVIRTKAVSLLLGPLGVGQIACSAA